MKLITNKDLLGNEVSLILDISELWHLTKLMKVILSLETANLDTPSKIFAEEIKNACVKAQATFTKSPKS